MAMSDKRKLSARRTAVLIKEELRIGDFEFANRTLMQALEHMRRTEDAADLQDFLIQPESTGDLTWDTFLAASVGRECELMGLERPAWTDPEPLKEEWHPGNRILTEGYRGLVTRDRSLFMAHYNILIRDRDYTTA